MLSATEMHGLCAGLIALTEIRERLEDESRARGSAQPGRP
jgi:hypothetical protein